MSDPGRFFNPAFHSSDYAEAEAARQAQEAAGVLGSDLVRERMLEDSRRGAQAEQEAAARVAAEAAYARGLTIQYGQPAPVRAAPKTPTTPTAFVASDTPEAPDHPRYSQAPVRPRPVSSPVVEYVPKPKGPPIGWVLLALLLLDISLGAAMGALHGSKVPFAIFWVLLPINLVYGLYKLYRSG